MLRRLFLGRSPLVSVAGLSLLLSGCDTSADLTTETTEPEVRSELQGLVMLDDIAPLPGVVVRLRRENATLAATSNVEGTFLIEDVRSGDWELFVIPPAGYQLSAGQQNPRTVEIASAGPANLRLAVSNGPETGSLVAQVFADSLTSSGNQFLTVGGVLVQIFAQGSSEASQVTRSGDNGFAIFSLSPGDYDVAIEVPQGWQMAADSQRRLNGLTIAAGASLEVSFRITQVGT